MPPSRRPKLRVVSSTRAFNKRQLSDEEYWAYNLCRKLAALPKITVASKLADAQGAYKREDFRTAIDSVLAYFRGHELDLTHGHDVNRFRFRQARLDAQVRSNKLAAAVGVTAGALCSFELHNGGLGLERVLVAAELIGIPPAEFITSAT